MIDWKEFCEQNLIEYREGGASSKQGNIYISCPYCPEDEKKLMGLELETGMWGCWREREHSGPDPVPLIMTLLRIGKAEARTMIGLSNPHPTAQSILGKLAAIKGKKLKDELVLDEFEFRSDIKRVLPGTRAYARVSAYLKKRGFRCRRDMIKHYGMRYHPNIGPEGAQCARVVMPVSTVAGDVVGYTARAIPDDCEIRYYSRPNNIKHHVFNAHHCARGGRVLIVSEGPFDAYKLDWVAECYKMPIRSVGIMGLVLTDGRVAELSKLARKFERVVLVLDRSALKQALTMQRMLPFKTAVAHLDRKYKDPGAIPWRSTRAFLTTFL